MPHSMGGYADFKVKSAVDDELHTCAHSPDFNRSGPFVSCGEPPPLRRVSNHEFQSKKNLSPSRRIKAVT